SCGGCEIAVLDINEHILDLIHQVDILLWPVALDTKYTHIRQMPDQFIDVCFFNGGVRNSEQEELAHLLRRKSVTLVAFGSCACYGGVPGLANLFSREQNLKTVYVQCLTSDNQEGILPATTTTVAEGELTLPKFYDRVLPLHQVVDVDYLLPGCPPAVPLILGR
ncbi:MAG: oxidoreductase, partial [candidate division WOR-3 bacterium]